MGIYYLILVAGFVFLTGSALLALRWALRSGQLKHPAKTALQIFDDEEPLGQMTDWFPGRPQLGRADSPRRMP